jgi:hypothetical protein
VSAHSFGVIAACSLEESGLAAGWGNPNGMLGSKITDRLQKTNMLVATEIQNVGLPYGQEKLKKGQETLVVLSQVVENKGQLEEKTQSNPTLKPENSA